MIIYFAKHKHKVTKGPAEISSVSYGIFSALFSSVFFTRYLFTHQNKIKYKHLLNMRIFQPG